MLTLAFISRALFTACALWFCLELAFQRQLEASAGLPEARRRADRSSPAGQKKNFFCSPFVLRC